ncbi:hypothetical protein G4177_26835 [Corallococcus sp. ZKHCc1 1396]|uniref:DUF1853 family protein n=1 Tax=Corallococcus soli TaxID=2710757 RepID=A0ABR9PV50_9BACT|nr:hypothetical protein [Corallococcus soli]MBE4751791.1 hypothetical protein [Corallococcus soli]
MGGWREVKRLAAGGDDAKEKVLQDIFNRWGERKAPVAGAPDWLWELPTPTRPFTNAFGYSFTPDAYWGQIQPRMVAELKYGTNFEPIAVAEALHHAHLLRLIEGGEPIRPILVTQLNYWIRATIAELGNTELRHIEADLLTIDSQTLLWLSAPHAIMSAPALLPEESPLARNWTSLHWFNVEGESGWSWVAHDGGSKTPFIQGPTAMLSKFRNGARYRWVLWTGQLPPLGTKRGQQDWDKAGSYWVWDANADSNKIPPPPLTTD